MSISSRKSYDCLPTFGTKTHIKNWQFYSLYFNNFLSFSFDLECKGWWCPMFQRNSPNFTRHKMTLHYVVFYANKSVSVHFFRKFVNHHVKNAKIHNDLQMTNFYHKIHLSLRFIFEPAGQLNALTKSSELEHGPMIRYFPGECTFVSTWSSSFSSVIFSHQT